MTGQSIAAEVDAALKSLASELGSGAFSIGLVRPAAKLNPWDADGPDTITWLAGNVQMYAKSEIDGALIQQGDRKVMLSATGERPTTADKLRIGGDDFAVVAVNEVAPQGVALFYEVQARV